MRQCAFRHVAHRASALPHLEAEVHVLHVHRITLVEASQFLEKLGRDKDASPGNGRHFQSLRHFRSLGLGKAVGMIWHAVVAKGDAGMLDASVRIEQPRAGQAALGMLAQSLRQRHQPALVSNRVVVEKDQKLSARRLGAGVARLGKATVLGKAHGPQAAAGLLLGKPGRRPVRGGVVYYDNFRRNAHSGSFQGIEALLRKLQLAVHGNDDGDLGRGAVRRRPGFGPFFSFAPDRVQGTGQRGISRHKHVAGQYIRMGSLRQAAAQLRIAHQAINAIEPDLGITSGQDAVLTIAHVLLIGRQVGINPGAVACGIFEPFDGALGSIERVVFQRSQGDVNAGACQRARVGRVIVSELADANVRERCQAWRGAAQEVESHLVAMHAGDALENIFH